MPLGLASIRRAGLLVAETLVRESVFSLALRRLRLSSFVDDHVEPLKFSPLGMFFYNQRGILFLAGGAFLFGLALLLRFNATRPENFRVLVTLLAFWLTGVAYTIFLHAGFRRQLRNWSSAPTPAELPPMFDRYFLLDSLLVVTLIVFGSQILKLPFEPFAFLLVANTVVYSAYIGGGRRIGIRTITAPIAAFAIGLWFLLSSDSTLPLREPEWFYSTLYFAPLSVVLLVTVVSTAMISWLRARDHSITRKHLELLGEAVRQLAKPFGGNSEKTPLVGRGDFDQAIERVLRAICADDDTSWYRSAILFTVETHMDRGLVLVPGPSLVVSVKPPRQGADIALVPPLERPALLEREGGVFPSLAGHTVPAGWERLHTTVVAIPVPFEHRQPGVLWLAGTPRTIAYFEEQAFLASLGSVIASAGDAWTSRYSELAQSEMETLFECRTIDKLFSSAAAILRKHLRAHACMVVYREDPDLIEMRVAAKEGLSDSVLRNAYRVGDGQTGKCAKTGRPTRWDSVDRHRDEFHSEHLAALETALGHRVRSWMAVPIGPPEDNYGVIKVINSSEGTWFTPYDEFLALALAKRLHLIIARFRYHAKLVTARDEAQNNLAVADAEREAAQSVAKQRDEDLLVIAHQLQAPLASIVTSITGLPAYSRRLLPPDVQERLTQIHAFVEDAITICYASVTTLASEAGQETAFVEEDIDAPDELKKLCARLQRTSRRKDLSFAYILEQDFPSIRIDRNVFTSVFYSLVHNALKYADPYTTVTFECSYERRSGQAALKVKSLGEPIQMNEREAIFDKYGRGEVLRRTGRKHAGVGLGLWIAKELLNTIRGSIHVELSAKDPRLSIFVVAFPREGVHGH